jgi:two-component system, HptB-dependent secretion and biofilm response regulator
VMDDPSRINPEVRRINERFANSTVEWSMHFEVKPTSFKVFDPLPLLLNVLMEVPSLRSFSSRLYTILTELYTNALEHGVLQLDSKLKNSPDGFAEYYALREKRIMNVKEGFVRIFITHKTSDMTGLLTVRIEDSGDGFDYKERNADSLHTRGYSGRGIALVEELCGKVTYLGCGNTVEAEFTWEIDD